MKYEESLEALKNMTKFGVNLGLVRIKSLLKHMNNPQDSLKYIHIGGTNGKGSTAAMLSAILRESGYRTGLYTSPHLVSYRERISVDSRLIPKEEFAGLMTEILQTYERVREETGEYPTEFEVLTALALVYFAREQVDLAILEVGLGGDLDSTNVISSSLVSIITNVSIDHTEHLGASPRLIAEKKSGIIKKGCPVLTASTNREVLEVLREKARSLEAPFYRVQDVASTELVSENLQGQMFKVRTHKADYGVLHLPFLGEHQLTNAALALVAAEILQEKGWRISKDTIASGLSASRWPGRLEPVSMDPLVILDGAHNAAGMEALSKWLHRNRSKYNRVILVIGMLDDKEREKAAGFLKPLVSQVIITRPNSPRSQKWQMLAQVFEGGDCPLTLSESIDKALKLALRAASREDLVLITGSLYLVGDARKILHKG